MFLKLLRKTQKKKIKQAKGNRQMIQLGDRRLLRKQQ